LVGKGFEHLLEVPVIGAFVRALLRNSVQTTRSILDVEPDYYYKLTGTSKHDRVSLLKEMSLLYRCSEHEILEIEAEMDSIDRLPFMVANPLMRLFVDVDLGRYHQESTGTGLVHLLH
jgi:hypothetical protein